MPVIAASRLGERGGAALQLVAVARRVIPGKHVEEHIRTSVVGQRSNDVMEADVSGSNMVAMRAEYL